MRRFWSRNLLPSAIALSALLLPASAWAQQADSALVAYATGLVQALTIGRGEDLSAVSDRLRKLAAPAPYVALQQIAASRARDVGRLQREMATLANEGDQVQITPQNARALEAAQQFPIAMDRYTAARDALLSELEKAGVEFRRE